MPRQAVTSVNAVPTAPRPPGQRGPLAWAEAQWAGVARPARTAREVAENFRPRWAEPREPWCRLQGRRPHRPHSNTGSASARWNDVPRGRRSWTVGGKPGCQTTRRADGSRCRGTPSRQVCGDGETGPRGGEGRADSAGSRLQPAPGWSCALHVMWSPPCVARGGSSLPSIRCAWQGSRWEREWS